jgi:hypothetical protein
MSEDTGWQRVKEVFGAALERPPEERATFVESACGEDLRLHEEVRSLLLAHDQAGTFLSRPALATSGPDLTGRRVGAYRAIGEIGKGGMGVVYRATREDDVFHKTVALKVVHGDAGADAHRRFARERQILARLQHPNIAAILDGGETDDGRPYLVMEHVDGEWIDVFCERRSLGLRQRLELFRTVCGAVHYAHQNLIVHRDLKPANILVCTDGQPKLLDFGIAALLAPTDVEPPAPATLLPAMTPDYASPEQVRGLPLTTASDVYSLGVVLYELLTGRLPLEVRGQSLGEMVHTVCDIEPAPPSSGRRALRGDIDVIVLKALRKEAARRYLSAQELAEDVGRYLAGRPVLARKDTVGYRLVKFVGRHRAGVAASAAMLLVVASAGVAIVRQARIAEANRIRAEARFAEVRQVANSFLFELHDAIKDLPGSTVARALVLRRAVEYLDRLAREAADDPLLQTELATAYERLAQVQGIPFGPNLGDMTAARESLRKEVALREALRARSPEDPAVAVAFLGSTRKLALQEDEIGQTQAGVERLRRARAHAEAFLALRPPTEAVRHEAARLDYSLGKLLFKTVGAAAALEAQRRSLAAIEPLAEANPRDARPLRELWLIHRDMAFSLASTGALAEADEHYRSAVAAAEARLALQPDDPMARDEAGSAYGDLGNALNRPDGDREAAARYMVRAVARAEERLRADPHDSSAQRNLAVRLSAAAAIAFGAGRLEESLALTRRSFDLVEARIKESPTSYQAREDVADGRTQLADAVEALERLDEAAAMRAQAIAELEALHAENPGQVVVLGDLAQQYAQAGALDERRASAAHDSDQRATRWRAARAANRRALDLWSEIETRGAGDAATRAGLAAAGVALKRCDAALTSGR